MTAMRPGEHMLPNGLFGAGNGQPTPIPTPVPTPSVLSSESLVGVEMLKAATVASHKEHTLASSSPVVESQSASRPRFPTPAYDDSGERIASSRASIDSTATDRSRVQSAMGRGLASRSAGAVAIQCQSEATMVAPQARKDICIEKLEADLNDAASVMSSLSQSSTPNSLDVPKPRSVSSVKSPADTCITMRDPHSSDDLTMAEIREQGLKGLLHSRLPLCYFLRFLLEEHSCENLICYLEIEHYEAQKYDSPIERQNAALQILDVYLSPRSPFEVNVTERAHAQCQAAIMSDDDAVVANCFVNVKPAVFQLLLDAYARFIRSEWWRRMMSQLDNKRTYSIEDRDATVNHLLGYLEHLHRHDLVHAPDRAALFRELIADFCRTIVGVEIIITPSPPSSLNGRSSTNSNPGGYGDAEGSQSPTRKNKSNPLSKLKNLRKWG
jgi:hypothetical protein